MSLPEVQAQYERYPYPPRKPEDEPRILFPTGMDQLDRLNHHVWAGQREMGKLRVLVAGGGTGDATVYLAEQLTALHPEGRPSIVHLDLSRTSLDIARARVQARGLDCVQFIQGSLLEARDLLAQHKDPHGKPWTQFDYINCSGVLHHLVDPDAGLAALTQVLAQDGAMGIMLYGQYGRTGVYQMQELLRTLFTGDETPEQKVELCHKVIETLPPTNWFARQRDQLMDLDMGDAAIYDLLLHPQDRAYTVPQVYEFLHNAGLNMINFVHLDGTARRHYDASNYWTQDALKTRIAQMDRIQSEALAELAAGNMLKHSFYCSKSKPVGPPPYDGSWIPDFSQRFDVKGVIGKEIAKGMRANLGQKFTIERSNCKVMVRANPRIATLIENIDGELSIDEVIKKTHLSLDPAAKDAELREILGRDFQRLYEAMGYYEWVFLRAPHLPRAPRMQELQLHTVRRLKAAGKA